LIEQDIFLLDVRSLVLAAFPAISPVANQKLEAEGIDLHAWLEADAQISKVHLVLVGMGQKQA
jgi:hypothetical protein